MLLKTGGDFVCRDVLILNVKQCVAGALIISLVGVSALENKPHVHHVFLSCLGCETREEQCEGIGIIRAHLHQNRFARNSR